ncbi:MAG: energy transducer TonB [Bacteroidales bacterium]|nr:energy transducer TonB [Bacteroidales bacterium]
MKTRHEEKRSLEKKRMIFFQAGLVITLALTLLAFEWRTADPYRKHIRLSDGPAIHEDLPEITFHRKELRPPVPVVNPVFVEVKNDQDVDDDVVIDAEVKDDTENLIDTLLIDFDPEPEPEDPVIHIVAEVMPEFPGGEAAMMQFLSDHITYPAEAREVGLNGTAYVTFVVWTDGTIRDIQILRDPGAGLGEEVVRVVKLMPPWKPGLQQGKRVPVRYNLPVAFKLN